MSTKPIKKKLSDEEQLSLYIQELKHPLKSELEMLRGIIKSIHPDIKERIKWNAPSYHYNGQDFLTFNLRNEKLLHLVFHHPSIVNIDSALLEGDYKDRRMIYFHDKKEIDEQSSEFKRILKQCIAAL